MNHLTPAEHYRRAEELLAEADRKRVQITEDMDDSEVLIRQGWITIIVQSANAHAALAAATNTTAALAARPTQES